MLISCIVDIEFIHAKLNSGYTVVAKPNFISKNNHINISEKSNEKTNLFTLWIFFCFCDNPIFGGKYDAGGVAEARESDGEGEGLVTVGVADQGT